jgi:hypothetical protein
MRWFWSIAVLLFSAGCFESAAQPGVCRLGDRRDCTCEEENGPGFETCYLDAPAVWGPCVCNMQPVASAGPNQIVSYKTLVTLDGTLSVDEDGPGRSYQWTFDSLPDGSEAMLNDPTNPRPSFFADMTGEYRFGLTVSDGLKTSTAASVRVTAVNDSPLALVHPGTKLHAGTTFQLDGSASTDPNGDALTYQWTVTSAPAGSVAAPASPTSATTQFVPDVVGMYQLSLSVSDGNSSSAPASLTLDVYFPYTMIPSIVRDAEYSRALDRVVVAGQSPNVLYVYDPTTGTSINAALPLPPLSLALSPDGLYAVVGHDGLVSVIDLRIPAFTLTKAVPVTSYDVVHGGNGYVYVFGGLNDRKIQHVPLNGGAVIAGADSVIQYRASLVPGAQVIYAIATVYDGIFRLDITNGMASITRGVTAKGCGHVWISDDAQRIFTGCGTLYSISNVAASDMQAVGTLSGMTNVHSLTQSSAAAKVLAADASGSGTVRFYSYPSLSLDKVINIPLILDGGTVHSANGDYVFLRADNITYAVIVTDYAGINPLFGMGTFSL